MLVIWSSTYEKQNESNHRWILELFDFWYQKQTNYLEKCHFWATLGIEKAISGINLRVKTEHFNSACTRILSFWTILFLVWYGKPSRSHDKALSIHRDKIICSYKNIFCIMNSDITCKKQGGPSLSNTKKRQGTSWKICLKNC